MHGVAAKVTEKVRMLFEDGGSYTCSSQYQPEHQSRGAAAHDTAASPGRRSRHVMNYPSRRTSDQCRWQGAFVLKQPTLGLQMAAGVAAGVSTESVAGDHAVARDDDRDWVGRHDLPDRPRRHPGAAELREFGISDRLPVTDGSECLEDRLGYRFHRRQIQGQCELPALTGEVLPQLPESHLHCLIRFD